MTYTCGIFGAEPYISCNECGLRRRVSRPHGAPFAWFLDNKAAPGWSLKRLEDVHGGVSRVDLCPRCKVQKRQEGTP
jgi:hypothetical protein